MTSSPFINPFDKYTDKTLATIAAIATLFGCIASWLFSAIHDGVIDLHMLSDLDITVAVGSILADILVLSVCLFAGARLINRKTRFQDIIFVAAIARIPYYLLSFLNINAMSYRATQTLEQSLLRGMDVDVAPRDYVIITLLALFSILALVWMILLLVNGFKVASNARGTKDMTIFVIALIVAEIASQLFIHNVLI